MIEVRTLEESPQDLSAFVTNIWRNDYAGRMVIPLWTADYFDWQLGMSGDAHREQLLGAYNGTRLVAVLLGLPLTMQVRGVARKALLSSWLSVAPEARGHGLVPRLKDEQARRLQDTGGEVILSYRYHGTRHSLADQPKAETSFDTGLDVRRVGLWVRLLDAPRAAEWYLKGVDRWLTRIGRHVVRSLEFGASSIEVRDLREDDFEACLSLYNEAAAEAELSIEWNAELLRRYLPGASVAGGVVGCRDGRVVAVFNYHLLPYLGRTEEPLGIIDLLLIDQLSHFERVKFLKAGLARIKEAGAILAVKMGFGDVPATALLDASFLFRGRDSLQVLRWLTPQAEARLRGKQFVLWR